MPKVRLIISDEDGVVMEDLHITCKPNQTPVQLCNEMVEVLEWKFEADEWMED